VIRSPLQYAEQSILAFKIPAQQTSRLLPLLFFPTWFINYYWIAVAVVLFNTGLNWKKYQPFMTLFLGIFVLAIFSASTSAMKMSANIPLMGIHTTLAFVLLYKIRSLQNPEIRNVKNRISIAILVLFTLYSIQVSAKRGLDLEAWTYGGLNPFGDYPLKTKQVEGWLAPKESGEAVDHLVEFIDQHIPKTESLLVLTDLQILYPLTKRDSYRGIPFIFSDGLNPPPGKQLEEVKNNILKNPPAWIVTHKNSFEKSMINFIIPYLGLRDFIMNSYAPVQSWNNYILLKKVA